MATKQLFRNYNARENGGRTLEEAIAELGREADVRRRLYDRWITEGRLTWVDARDRLERLLSAIAFLVKLDAPGPARGEALSEEAKILASSTAAAGQEASGETLRRHSATPEAKSGVDMEIPF